MCCCASRNVWRRNDITPIRLSGYVHVGRVLNAICSAAGLLITRDSIGPLPRFTTADWPLKMPFDGAVTIVVTPIARRASASSSVSFTLRMARKSGVGSAGRSVRSAPDPRRETVAANPREVWASMRPG